MYHLFFHFLEVSQRASDPLGVLEDGMKTAELL